MAERREPNRPFDGLSNFRDAGGLRTSDGRCMKAGVLFRSDELSRMTRRDLSNLREFNIKLICDLRTPEECRKKRPRAFGRTVRVVNIPMYEQAEEDLGHTRLLGFLFGSDGGDRFDNLSRRYYHHLAFEQTARLGEVLTLISREGSLPALIHCSAGRDRTGFVVAVIQLLAGVPDETVREDYLLANEYFAPRIERFIKAMRVLTLFQVSPERMRLVMMARPEYLDEVHRIILKNNGCVETYLHQACGVDRKTLRSLKDRLLE